MWQPLNGEPSVPAWGIIPQPDEPAHRFFARLSALNGQHSARSLAHRMGLNGRSAADLLEFCLALPIREKERLRASTACMVGSQVILCRQTFSKNDWSVHTARVCPVCLSESEHARNWWDLKVVFRCPFHDEPLIRGSGGSVTRWWTPSPARFVDETPAWKSGPVGGTSTANNSWEAYVLGRMKIGPTVPVALLDDIASMAEVVRAVEHVGRASIADYSDRRPTLRPTGAAREEIIRAGFAALSDGYAALRRIAARVADSSPEPRSEIEQWGARKLFGWLGRSYEANHPIVPEFEKALRDEAHSRSIYQGWTKFPVYRPTDTPLTMLGLARLLSLSSPMARKLAIDLGFAYKTSTRRKHLFTSAIVGQIREFKDSLLDRDAAAALMGIDRGYFDALVHEGLIARSYRFVTQGILSDRFHSKHISDCERLLCRKFGKNWRRDHIPKRKRGVKFRPKPVPTAPAKTGERFRAPPKADGVGLRDAAAVLRVDLVTIKRLVEAGILAMAEGSRIRTPRVTHESLEHARKRYAPALFYADNLPNRSDHEASGEALAALGAIPLQLGPDAMAIVDRAAARKALHLHQDPDRVPGSLFQFWQAVEDAIRAAVLPFRSNQSWPQSMLMLWDSSRLVRLAFTIAEDSRTIVGAVASTRGVSRRNAILPLIADNLRAGQALSPVGYELDDSGMLATLREFDVHDAASWPKAIAFVTEYLTNVRHGLYDARARLREAVHKGG